MTFSSPACLAASLGLLLLAGCATSDYQATTQDLSDKMQAQLAPEITAGRVGLAASPSGAVVTLQEPSLFPAGSSQLDERGQLLLARVIEGLLDPGLLHIAIAAPPGEAYSLHAARAQAVTQYLTDHGLNAQLATPAAQPGAAGTPPQGLSIAVTVATT